VSETRTHWMCACSKYSCAQVCNCVVNRCAFMCTCGYDRGALMCLCFLYSCTLMCNCAKSRHAYVSACEVENHAHEAKLGGLKKLVFFEVFWCYHIKLSRAIGVYRYTHVCSLALSLYLSGQVFKSFPFLFK
jgi:hypothetical protein